MTLLDRMSQGWKAWALLFIITFGAAAPGVFMMPALDRDESRYAQASKQMLEEGDLILIRYQDELRNKKPVGIHWLQAGATAAFTGPEAKAIWTHRVPSWLGAAFATLACFWAGIPLIGRRAAFLGSALFGATILLTTEAHIAKTDALLACLITLSIAALARLYTETGPPRPLAILFWVALAASFLVKGPVGLMVAGLTGAGIWLWDKRRSGEGGSWWRPLLWLPGPALFLIIVLPWFVAVEILSGGTFLAGAVGEDLTDKVAGASEGHGGPPGYHLIASLVVFFPATLLVVPAIAAVLRALRGKTLTALGHGTDGLKFLLAWVIPTWLFFEILPTKLVHYVLPAYPALALLCGYGAVQLMDGLKMPRARGFGMILFSAGAILLLTISFPGVTSYLMADTAGDFRTVSQEEVLAAWAAYREYPLWLWAAGFALAGLAVIESARMRTGAAITLAICASIAIGWHVRGVMLPSQVWAQPTETARLALEDVCGVPGEDAICNVPVPARVLALGYSEPSYVMTLGTQNLHPPQTPLDLPADPAAYPVVYLLNFEERGDVPMTERAATLRQQGAALSLCLTEGASHYALNYSNGRPVHFRAWRFDWGGCP